MSTIYKYKAFRPTKGLQHVVVRTTASETSTEYTEQHLWLPDAAAADLVESMQRPITQFCVGDLVSFRASPAVCTVIAASLDKRGVIYCTTLSDLGWVAAKDLTLHKRATTDTILNAQAFVEHANTLASL